MNLANVCVALAPPLLLLLIGGLRGLKRGLGPADESYLVYGTLRLLQGRVPIRDFRAYDPGRYLWCALFFAALGPGYVTARIAMLTLGAASATAVSLGTLWFSGLPLLAAATGCLSVFWLHPGHKQGEILLSVLFTLALARMGGEGDSTVFAAFLLAAAAIYAHNMLVYMIAALVLFAGAQGGIVHADRLLVWTGGLFGAIFLLGCFVPGYWRAFWRIKVRTVVKRGAANLPLPKPWLWSRGEPQLRQFHPLRRWTFRFVFTVLPLAYASAILVSIFVAEKSASPAASVIVAAGFIGLPMLHHLWSRADLGHLAMIAQPAVLISAAAAALAIPGPAAALVPGLLSIATFFLLWQFPEFSDRWQGRGKEQTLATGFETLKVAPSLAERLATLDTFVRQHAPPGAPILCVPLNIATLVISGRDSAIFDVFPVHPSTPQGQEKMLADLRASCPPVAILGRARIDSRAGLMFACNYDRVADYVEAHFDLVAETPDDAVYRRKAHAKFDAIPTNQSP